ncbi:MAG: hypothetical protein ABI317_05880, partial [Gaiellales bacterium]
RERPQYADRRRELEARRALEAVGALGWRDVDGVEQPHRVVERVIVAPAHAPGALAVSSLVLFDHAVRVHWYAQEAVVASTELALQDDAGTRYVFERGGRSEGIVGATSFRPAPPAEATWLDVVRDGERVARVPLT